MRRLTMLLIPFLAVALIVTTVGCGSNNDEPTPTLTPTATTPGVSPTPGDGTETPVYTGGKHTFKIAHSGTVESSTQEFWLLVDQKLRDYTNDKVKLEIYPAGSLYGSYEVWDALSTGAVDIANLGDYQPMLAGYMNYQIGYLNQFWGSHVDWENQVDDAWEHDRRFWDHPQGGQTMFKEVEKSGVKMLACFPSGALQVIMNKFGMTTMYQMKDRKIATVGGIIGLFCDYADATGVMVDPVEFPIAFQQGMLDLLATGPESCVNQRLYETGKYGYVISALFSHTFWGINLKLWNSLEPELQDIIMNKIIPEMKEWVYTDRRNLEWDALKDLEELGVTLTYQPDEEKLEMRDGAWTLGWERGYMSDMDIDLVKLADSLRSEPYDQQELPFPDE